MRVAVVSPLPTVRAGLRALLEAGGAVVVTEAAALGPEALSPDSAPPDVVVVDPYPDAAVDPAWAAGIVDAGASLVVLGDGRDLARLAAGLIGHTWAYLGRDTDADRLGATLAALGHGLVVLAPSIGDDLLAGRAGAPHTRSEAEDVDDLTAREREVLTLVALGLTNKAIARRLSISDHTVKFHVAAILAKLGAASRAEAVHLGARRGLIAL
ncbi:MAG: response regulator transcription factor [Chloroflexi bacterium]|nr:response regulator transcription factor [Chloroflexota bacterium]